MTPIVSLCGVEDHIGGCFANGNQFHSNSLNPCCEGLKIKDAEEAGVSRLYVQVFTVRFLTESLIARCLFRNNYRAGASCLRGAWLGAATCCRQHDSSSGYPVGQYPIRRLANQSGAAAYPASGRPIRTTQDSSQDPLKRKLSDKEQFKQQKEVREELKGPYKKWVNEDVHWIITDQELKAFKSLSNDEERDNFIEQFWLRRNPNPDSPENEFREEHYRRIAYANEHFAAGKPGGRRTAAICTFRSASRTASMRIPAVESTSVPWMKAAARPRPFL